ncbi:MAG: hypothetical protein ABI321_24955 [Polyangia bacterium]
MRSSLNVAFVWVCALAVCAPAAFHPAHASPASSKSEARQRYDAGTRHYNLAEYADALVQFKEGYRLRPDPVFLFNIAQCYRLLSEPEEAATFYRSFLREQPEAPNRADVERMVGEQEAIAHAKRDRAANAERAKAVVVLPVAPPVAVTPAVDVALAAPAPAHPKPLVKKPWFWVAVVGGAGVVAAAIVVGVVLGGPRNPHASLGAEVLQ